LEYEFPSTNLKTILNKINNKQTKINQ